MNVQQPESFDLDRILSSDEFAHSEMNRRLLRYLVEKSLSGQIPKEINIAIDVFGKDSSYNPNTDSLVRSHIYTLRNKLEKYYLTAGQSEKIHLVIPKGRYEVVFLEASESDSHPKRSFRTRWLSLSGFVLFCLALFFLIDHFFVLKSQSIVLKDEQLSDIPWTALKESDKPVLFVIGDFFVYVHRKNDQYGNRRIRNGKVNSFDDLMNYYDRYPNERQDFSGLTHTYVSPAVTKAAVSLYHSFAVAGMNIEYKHASELTEDDLLNFNIVYVGPLKTLRLLTPYFNKTGFQVDFYPHLLTYEEESDTTNLSVFNAEIENGLQYRKDYGFIIQVPGPADNTIMLVTAFSTNSIPILSDVLNSGEFEDLIDSTRYQTFPPYFKAVFQVDIISDTSVRTLIDFSEINIH